MDLYFLRHAIAADRVAGIKEDSERPLTPEGISKTKKSLKGMKALGLRWDAIVSSPYLRAKETAQVVAEGLKFSSPLIFSSALTPKAKLPDFLELLKELEKEEKILFVGHQPTLGEFISSLVSGHPDAHVDLNKGGLCFVKMLTFGQGELEWLLTADQLCAF